LLFSRRFPKIAQMKKSMREDASFPRVRLRRNRKSDWSRRLVAESRLSTDDLILPLFVTQGKNKKIPVTMMPGVFRLSVDLAVEKIKEARELGIPAVAIFPSVDAKLRDAKASEALNPENLICQAVAAIKKSVPDIGVITDVALDPYTSHGQDGLVKNGEILNDETVKILCRQAVIQARAGADIIAPSDMMDGRIGAIRDALDTAGFQAVQIMSYAAKYASNFYGPFRDAVGSAKNLGAADKKTYQMDFANSDEALREVALDISEGADMILVKPGMPYLDILRRVRETFHIPVFGYQVSGEYAMIKAAAAQGWLDEKAAFYESMIAFKRAGATGIFTYYAIEMARELSGAR